MKHVLYSSLACVAFFASAVLLNHFALWSRVANVSIPWLLSAIGMSIGLLGIHAWFDQRAVSPMWHIRLFLVITVIAFIAVLVDDPTRVTSHRNKLVSDLLEVVAFAVIYGLLIFPTFIYRKPKP